MAKRTPIPDETIAKIRALLKEKKEAEFWSYRLSFAGIAEQCGVSKDTVENVDYRRSYVPTDGKIRKKLSVDQVIAVKEILAERDLKPAKKITYKNIAEKLDIPVYVIMAINSGVSYANIGN